MLLAGEEHVSEDGDQEEKHTSAATNFPNSHVSGLEDTELDSETELMKRMGLPVQFGSATAHKKLLVNFPYFFSLFYSSMLLQITEMGNSDLT